MDKKFFLEKTKMKRQKQTTFNSSMTGVNPSRTHGFGIWGNERVVMGVRVDRQLKTEATKILIKLYGSTCRGIEAYLAGIVATYHSKHVNGVNPSYTSPISIGKLVIERNIRTRRRLVVEEETRTTMIDVRRQKEDEWLNRVFQGVYSQWGSLKPKAKAYHLRKAKENNHLKSAKLLLELTE